MGGVRLQGEVRWIMELQRIIYQFEAHRLAKGHVFLLHISILRPAFWLVIVFQSFLNSFLIVSHTSPNQFAVSHLLVEEHRTVYYFNIIAVNHSSLHYSSSYHDDHHCNCTTRACAPHILHNYNDTAYKSAFCTSSIVWTIETSSDFSKRDCYDTTLFV